MGNLLFSLSSDQICTNPNAIRQLPGTCAALHTPCSLRIKLPLTTSCCCSLSSGFDSNWIHADVSDMAEVGGGGGAGWVKVRRERQRQQSPDRSEGDKKKQIRRRRKRGSEEEEGWKKGSMSDAFTGSF